MDMLKKLKKLAVAPKRENSKKSIKFLKKAISFSSNTAPHSNGENSKKSIKFLKKAISFSSNTAPHSNDVPKGFLAVCVGDEMKRFVIPTDYLHHDAFIALLREAEEEYGFQQEGVLRIPCEVAAFETILEMVQRNKEGLCYANLEVEIELEKYNLSERMISR